MPLIKSGSDASFKSNVSEMIKAGHPQGQALAAAYRMKREHRALGGWMPTTINHMPLMHKQAHVGPIASSVPGRTDAHAMDVPSGSHVLPADHVSSLGQGNTAAGFSILGKMFPRSGPYGSGMPKIVHGAGAPKMGIKMPNLKMPHVKSSEGGEREGDMVGEPTPVNTAGGEFVIAPEDIIARYGNLKRGHEILDNWILENRKQHVKTLKGLPGPAKN